MDKWFEAEVDMQQCHVCGYNEFREEFVSELFQIGERPVLVENIPAHVCGRCGEPVFSQQTTEQSVACYTARLAQLVQ